MFDMGAYEQAVKDLKDLTEQIIEKTRVATGEMTLETRREVLRAVARRLSAEADRLEEDWG